MINPATICHHTKFLHIINSIPYAVYYIPMTYLFYIWKSFANSLLQARCLKEVQDDGKPIPALGG